jgi:hypothetical protein
VSNQLKAVSLLLRCRRGAAALAAASVLLAQLIAAAHVHPGFLVRTVSDRTRVAVSEATCPVCVFHIHTPTSANSGFFLIFSFLSEAFVATARRSRRHCTTNGQVFGRAPPAMA